MGSLKRLTSDPVWQRRISRTIAGTLELLDKTCRMEFVAHPDAQAIMESDEGVLAGYWHGRCLFLPLLWRGVLRSTGRDLSTPAYALSTPHRDGVIMAQALNMVGVKSIMGSSRYGGTEAFREIRRTLKEGGRIAISVDGGKGPRQRVQGGIMLLAKHSGCPVIPTTGSCRTGRQLNSWDRMLLPMPGTKGVLMMGAPIRVPKDADREELARFEQQYEDAMNALMDEADRRCGREPTLPAPRKASTEAVGAA
ncbi:MAG TPA: lysophospholipid acyltransferase family protein [Geminicoccus sp.]|uniref:lysophospholipid acyltransferase family protein n=1 Tax=Geminicoccus sp. TaxID=2024832 RepID=UPI002E32E20D|nr:lysophospholipid acyltransferase family protein [Geminicoccus sp.]HEX2526528.1 lysophospholipid acyltransferase family protein [Geminicoccus sp.]